MMVNMLGFSALAGKAAAPEGADNRSGGSAATQQQQQVSQWASLMLSSSLQS